MFSSGIQLFISEINLKNRQLSSFPGNGLHFLTMHSANSRNFCGLFLNSVLTFVKSPNKHI